MASQEAIVSGIEQFINSEECKIPYPNSVPYEEQEKIRLRIETFLLKNKIVSSDRLTEMHRQHLTFDEWKLIDGNPERYWPTLFASRMSYSEREKIDTGGFIKETYSVQESKRRYFVSSRVWTGVAEHFYFQTHGELPSPNEEEAIISQCTGPYHRCFFVLAEPVAQLEVRYDWAEDFFKRWENDKQEYLRTHPQSKERAA